MKMTEFSKTHENPKFKSFIIELLKSGDLNDHHIDILTDESGMIEFSRAFTSPELNNNFNYEFYEILGDSLANHVVVWYFMRRFPDIFNKPSGVGGELGPVGIMGRLKINGISKKTFSSYSDSWGFWNYVRIIDEERIRKTKILEDTFEAFIGCLSFLIEDRIGLHLGYCIVYGMMEKLMDKTEVKLDYESLYDSNTILNNLKGQFRTLISIEYEVRENPDYINNPDSTSHLNRYIGHVWIIVNKNKIKTLINTFENINENELKSFNSLFKNLKDRYGTDSRSYGVNSKEAKQKASDALIKSGILTELKTLLDPILNKMEPAKSKFSHFNMKELK